MLSAFPNADSRAIVATLLTRQISTHPPLRRELLLVEQVERISGALALLDKSEQKQLIDAAVPIANAKFRSDNGQLTLDGDLKMTGALIISNMGNIPTGENNVTLTPEGVSIGSIAFASTGTRRVNLTADGLEVKNNSLQFSEYSATKTTRGNHRTKANED